MKQLAIGLLGFLSMTTTATSGFLPGKTYEEAIHDMAQKLQAVGGANGLGVEEQSLAEETVLTWFALGPCERSDQRTENSGSDALSAVIDSVNFYPKRSNGKWSTPPRIRAITEMVAALLIMDNGLGRIDNNGYLCRYAASRQRRTE